MWKEHRNSLCFLAKRLPSARRPKIKVEVIGIMKDDVLEVYRVITNYTVPAENRKGREKLYIIWAIKI